MDNKIGLCIQEIFSGERRKYESTPNAPWLQRVVDFRTPAIGKAALPVGSEFRLITFAEDGVFVVSGITASGGRPNDYYAAWLYIPENCLLSISGKNLVEWTNKLIAMLKDYDGDVSPFKKFYDGISKNMSGKILHLKASALPNSPTAVYAMRCYDNEESLEQILSPYCIQQPNDAQFCGTLLIKRNEKPEMCKLQDISVRQLYKLTFVALDPSIPSQVIVEYGNKNTVFTKGTVIVRYIGEELILSFKHKDTRYIPSMPSAKVKVTDNMSIKPTDLKWKVRIPLEIFVVADQNGELVKEWKITNYQNDGEAIIVKEEEAKNISLTFEARGYKKTTIKANVLEQEKVFVEMPYLTETHVYVLPSKAKDIDDIEIELEERVGFFKSPIPMYNIKGHKKPNYKYLCLPTFTRIGDFKNKSFYKHFRIPLICSLIIGFLLGLFVMWVIPSGDAPKQKQQTQATANASSQSQSEGNDTINTTGNEGDSLKTNIQGTDTIQ